MEEIKLQRECFMFQNIWWEWAKTLPEDKLILAFMDGIVMFGIEHIEPGFSYNEQMQDYWKKIRPVMERDWKRWVRYQRRLNRNGRTDNTECDNNS